MCVKIWRWMRLQRKDFHIQFLLKELATCFWKPPRRILQILLFFGHFQPQRWKFLLDLPTEKDATPARKRLNYLLVLKMRICVVLCFSKSKRETKVAWTCCIHAHCSVVELWGIDEDFGFELGNIDEVFLPPHGQCHSHSPLHGIWVWLFCCTDLHHRCNENIVRFNLLSKRCCRFWLVNFPLSFSVQYCGGKYKVVQREKQISLIRRGKLEICIGVTHLILMKELPVRLLGGGAFRSEMKFRELLSDSGLCSCQILVNSCSLRNEWMFLSFLR